MITVHVKLDYKAMHKMYTPPPKLIFILHMPIPIMSLPVRKF